MPEVSVIIVCMNRLGNLYPCLESLRKNTSVTYETLVVAYMFTPGNLARAKADFPWVEFIRSNEIRGIFTRRSPKDIFTGYYKELNG